MLARHAEAVELCLFDEAGAQRVVPLRHRSYGIWWDHVPGVAPGQRYGYRVHGPWAPRAGHRHNPAKLLMDPYAVALESEVRWGPEVFGHRVDAAWQGDGERRDDRDSAACVPRSVVLGDGFDWSGDEPPAVPWTQTVLYEAHVRGLTMRHPGVPEKLRGTYAALGHPAVLDHLQRLGVTSLELLPIHTFTDEPHLVKKDLSNYWGYNTLGFFAPHAGYAAAQDPQGMVEEVKGAVKVLHGAGIEVILDVVYNHTCEQSGRDGATLSWRGLDNATYYRLDEAGHDVDVTGCGNTVDLRRPMVAAMVLDSLRHWVQTFHVDGFRFDLAPALARGRDDAYERDHAFHVALRTDPVLSRVKLIAEPWDIGVHGWRTGQFPPPFAEWNDRFRDTARTFWLSDVARDLSGESGHGVRDLATRIAGSPDLFGGGDRGPIAAVNLVTAHDGFTAADLTAYERKHNEANGEGNRDGHGDNRSWNHGVEGVSDDTETLATRHRSLRNLLATMLLSPGVPMLTAGDELGRTQGGNNNAYCQDNETSWMDWALADWQVELLADVRGLVALRSRYAVLRPREFPTFEPVPGRVRLRWFDEAGAVMTEQQWHDPGRRIVQALFDTAHDSFPAEPVLLVVNGGGADAEVVLPTADNTTSRPPWHLLWSSADTLPTGIAATEQISCVPATSLVLLAPSGDGSLHATPTR
ncbi:MAG: glycogen debranching protein GlgX [Actinobacteria bacterium]|nr:glycogen debranching protein GlgX [Actinomycetota bacterium]